MVLYMINKHINRWRHAVVQCLARGMNKGLLSQLSHVHHVFTFAFSDNSLQRLSEQTGGKFTSLIVSAFDVPRRGTSLSIITSSWPSQTRLALPGSHTHTSRIRATIRGHSCANYDNGKYDTLAGLNLPHRHQVSLLSYGASLLWRMRHTRHVYDPEWYAETEM